MGADAHAGRGSAALLARAESTRDSGADRLVRRSEGRSIGNAESALAEVARSLVDRSTGIVALNDGKDPPVTQLTGHFLVGNLFKVVPEFAENLKAFRSAG